MIFESQNPKIASTLKLTQSDFDGFIRFEIMTIFSYDILSMKGLLYFYVKNFYG